MVGKKRLGFRPIDRYEEAKVAADWAMAARGYQPCLDKYQTKPMDQLDRGIIQRLYTTDSRRGTEHGGVSIGFVKDELLKPHWGEYVAAQVKLALSRA